VYNLPKVEGAGKSRFNPTRVQQVIKSDFASDLYDFYYDGQVIKVNGLLTHPKYHKSRTSHEYIFVNSRPIYDRGIVRSVLQGFHRYIPHSEKIPFLINIDLRADLVDVNIHPRKEEVRFVNPYRVYSAIENAVSAALQREIKSEMNMSVQQYTSSDSASEIGVTRLRDSGGAQYRKTNSGKIKELRFGKGSPSKGEISNSLEFSKSLLKSKQPNLDPSNLFGATEVDERAKQEVVPSITPKSIFQIFNKYIIVEFANEVWIVDQHAAAERMTFETLMYRREEESTNSQKLLLAEKVNISLEYISFIKENLAFFIELGFEIKCDDDVIEISAVPSILKGANVQELLGSLFEKDLTENDLKRDFQDIKENVLASMACHTSIRSGQKLESVVMQDLIKRLVKCENPYSCPHGRPAVWRLKLNEIDSHFDRTY